MADHVVPVDVIAQAAVVQLPSVKFFESRHNTTAYLLRVPDKRENCVFFPIIDFFLRSRISHALTAHVENIYENHMTDFWTSAEFRRDDGPPCIRAVVDNKPIVITEAMIRQTLQLEDSLDANNDIPRNVIDECLRDMGSIRPLNEPEIKKVHVCPHWKFFEHVLIGCLSSRKGGMDAMNYQLAGLMVALIQNHPYNFSRFIFSNLVSNLDDPFFMYPRFLQIIFNTHLQDLTLSGRVLHYVPMQKRVFSDCRGYRGKPVPPVTALFGHIVDENFMPPMIEIQLDFDAEEEEEEEEHVHIQQDLHDIEHFQEVNVDEPVEPDENPLVESSSSDDEGPRPHTLEESIALQRQTQENTGVC